MGTRIDFFKIVGESQEQVRAELQRRYRRLRVTQLVIEAQHTNGSEGELSGFAVVQAGLWDRSPDER